MVCEMGYDPDYSPFENELHLAKIVVQVNVKDIYMGEYLSLKYIDCKSLESLLLGINVMYNPAQK